MYLQLEQIKHHLNIDQEWTGDDDYLIFLAHTAQAVVEKHIDCNLEGLCDGRGDLPSPLLHAMLLFIGDMYNNRESISYANPHAIPFSYDYLLSLYKDYSGGKS
jgi:hypothetical protein